MESSSSALKALTYLGRFRSTRRGGRDDRQAHAVALGRHTLVWSSPVAGGARRVRHPAERAAPCAGAGVPRADSPVRIGLGPVIPLARSGGLRPTCVLDRPERLEIHWSGVPHGLRGGDVAGRFRLAGRARRYYDGGHRALGRRARRSGRRVSLWQDVPRLESLWDRRLRGRRPPRHAIPLAWIYRGDEHCVDATPPVRVDTVILRAAGGDGTFHAPRTAALLIVDHALSGVAHPHRLDVHEFVDPELRQLAPIAALLHAAERQARVGSDHAVDEHGAGLDS